MKQLFSTLIAVLVAFIAFGQSTPTNKLRSNDSFTQVDNYLVAAKRLGIPTGAALTLDGATSSQNSAKLFWRTSDSTLHVYVPAIAAWLPAGGGQQGGGTWGSITGDLSDQTDLQDSLDAKLDTSAHGFGLSWNPTTEKMDWGTQLGITRYVELPEGQLFSLGTSYLEQGPKIYVNKINGALQEAAIVSGDLTSSYAIIGASEHPTTGTLEAAILVGGNGAKMTSSGILNYISDYSSTFVERSLVDKGYVDDAVGRMFTYTTSGGGPSVTSFTFPHGLGYTPTMVIATGNSEDTIIGDSVNGSPISGGFRAYISGANVIIDYQNNIGLAEGPAAGTNNLTWTILVK